MKYPKIETLYNRDEKFKVDPSQLRLPEFRLINKWLITEKIDGTNVRVFLNPDGTVRFGGRTDRAQMPTFLLSRLQDMFTAEKMIPAFKPDEDGTLPPIILFGEGYGPKIQKGSKYRPDVSFRLFDVRVGEWWLNWNDIEDIARKLGVRPVPLVAIIKQLPTCKTELEDIMGDSVVAYTENNERAVSAEGIVARTDPLLFRRNGGRVMWKLKFKDF